MEPVTAEEKARLKLVIKTIKNTAKNKGTSRINLLLSVVVWRCLEKKERSQTADV